MNKNRVILMLGVISLLMVSMAVSTFQTKSFSSNTEYASDFYQRHPDWTVNGQNAGIPVTGAAAFPDYHQRHPELNAPAESSDDTTDYYFRHPELSGASSANVDLTDYYFRHFND